MKEKWYFFRILSGRRGSDPRVDRPDCVVMFVLSEQVEKIQTASSTLGSLRGSARSSGFQMVMPFDPQYRNIIDIRFI